MFHLGKAPKEDVMGNFGIEVLMAGFAGLGLAAVAYGVMAIRRLTDLGTSGREDEGKILVLYSVLLAGTSVTVFMAVLAGVDMFMGAGAVLLTGVLSLIAPYPNARRDAVRRVGHNRATV